MKKILLIAPIYTEIVTYVNELPKGNEEFQTEKVEQRVSGGGYWLASIMNRFGFPYELASPVGTGVYGDLVKDTCTAQGIPLKETEGINGCVYTMIDDHGAEGNFYVPGSEYAFSLDDVQDIDPEEIRMTVLFGEMLLGDAAADVIEALDDLDKPLLFVPGNRVDEINQDVMDALRALHPQLFLTDAQAYYLCEEQGTDLSENAHLLETSYGNTVFIVQDTKGIYCCESSGQYLAPSSYPSNFNMQLGGYLAASSAGIDTHRSLLYANTFVDDCRGHMPSPTAMETEKRKLADLILERGDHV